MKIRAFITHKPAEEDSDCQDFFLIDKEKGAIAVSDGVSQSIFPKLWAEILCEKYVKEDWNLTDDVSILRNKWLERVNLEIEREEKLNNPYMRIAKNMLAQKKGAGATLCGIRFKGKEYSYDVLGDSALVFVDADNKVTSVCTSMESFGNRPDYFDSFHPRKGEPVSKNGTLESDEKILLVTDAIAEFLNKEKDCEHISELLDAVFSLQTHEEFCVLVDKWRNEYGMHNDDTTIVIVEEDGSEEFSLGQVDDIKELEKNSTNTSSVPSTSKAPTVSLPKTKKPEIKKEETKPSSEEKVKEETEKEEKREEKTSSEQTVKEEKEEEVEKLRKENEALKVIIRNAIDCIQKHFRNWNKSRDWHTRLMNYLYDEYNKINKQ